MACHAWKGLTMFLFAQTQATQDAAQIAFWIGYVFGQVTGLVICTAIVSGIFHLISVVSKNRSIRFLKVFPWVFVVLLVLLGINAIQKLLMP